MSSIAFQVQEGVSNAVVLACDKCRQSLGSNQNCEGCQLGLEHAGFLPPRPKEDTVFIAVPHPNASGGDRPLVTPLPPAGKADHPGGGISLTPKTEPEPTVVPSWFPQRPPGTQAPMALVASPQERQQFMQPLRRLPQRRRPASTSVLSLDRRIEIERAVDAPREPRSPKARLVVRAQAPADQPEVRASQPEVRIEPESFVAIEEPAAGPAEVLAPEPPQVTEVRQALPVQPEVTAASDPLIPLVPVRPKRLKPDSKAFRMLRLDLKKKLRTATAFRDLLGSPKLQEILQSLPVAERNTLIQFGNDLAEMYLDASISLGGVPSATE